MHHNKLVNWKTVICCIQNVILLLPNFKIPLEHNHCPNHDLNEENNSSHVLECTFLHFES